MKFFKNTYKFIALLFVGLICFNSCTDLKEELYSEIPSEGYDFSDNDIRAMFGPAYKNLRLLYWGWNGTFDIYEESSDLIMTPLRIGVGWGDLYVTMHKHTYTNQTGHFWTIWNQAYSTITSCNQLLERDLVKKAPLSSAELKGIRGVSYYLLLDNFRNVPLDTLFTHEPGFLPVQEDPQKMFEFIESEMKDIKEVLKGKEVVYGQFNYYAASMVLAKMYLNYNTWFGTNDNTYYQKAYDEVNDIIKNGPFALSSSYTDPFKADGSACSETIYAIVYDFVHAGGNYLSNKCLHGGSKATFNLKAAPWNGSCAIPQFIQTYDQDDSRFDDTWLMGIQKDISGSDIIIEGVPLNYTQSVHSIDNPGAYQMEGARFHKYEIVAGEEGSAGDDVPFFRLTDAYMIKAECLLRLGSYNGEGEQIAANIVSMIRGRAFKANPDKAVRTVADLKGPSVYQYGHQENTAQEGEVDNLIVTNEGGADIEFGGFLDDLAWEFVGEHHRRQDLIRFKLTSGSSVYIGKSCFCRDAHFDAAKEIFPIPKDFLESNSKLVQNPGYN
ncbi:RagB/SusD family nutrient uptake outer membrane protein [Labilibaculum euxinus]|uniref:RagB/SusD family nutrient uptake outer membrane protein n=1 Tax=Labilibaculum euxinus TaxID=2686357 RepID=A0A7M4D3K4_9BACT|nr:RagB/SusD family nutrient uptake outer membrane protein [Labilibaculum euxinus]MUP37233.1 RagB/SusD family nutrient uptake outer membrane protein [Labilibaculum euxinus]MVB06438.1 RagB/SusD family nutrient uptake outer membrane protein [Labilibaculum euxinus]